MKSKTSFLEHKKLLVEAELSKIFSEQNGVIKTPIFQESLSYTLALQGKRIRPALALAIYEMFKESSDDIVRPACALELVHTGSLMLDDLPSMDNARLRKGKTVHHKMYGESVTILASAALWMKAFEILSELDHPRALELVKSTSDLVSQRGLIVGQYIDLYLMDEIKTKQQLEYCYELKTAGLFRLATKYGAILGEATDDEVEALDEFARLIGIAFQIRDDILDFTETEESSGKDVQKDIENEKENYVSLFGLEDSKIALNNMLIESVATLYGINRDCSKLIAITKKLKVK